MASTAQAMYITIATFAISKTWICMPLTLRKRTAPLISGAVMKFPMPPITSRKRKAKATKKPRPDTFRKNSMLLIW